MWQAASMEMKWRAEQSKGFCVWLFMEEELGVHGPHGELGPDEEAADMGGGGPFIWSTGKKHLTPQHANADQR